MEKIIQSLKEKYQPLSLIVYGSYADGTNGEGSDFDCLIVSRVQGISHDTSIVHGVQLDAFIYAPEELDALNPYDLVQIENGSVVMDTHGIAILLKEKVRAYLRNLPEKSHDEILSTMEWLEKMAKRTVRGDAEGYFRWHWLLCDSLELYCDLRGTRYLGPKKSLAFIERKDPQGHALYASALKNMDQKTLTDWMNYLKKLAELL